MGLVAGRSLHLLPTRLTGVEESYLLLDGVQGGVDLELEDLRPLVQQLPGVEDVCVAPVVLATLPQHDRVQQPVRSAL